MHGWLNAVAAGDQRLASRFVDWHPCRWLGAVIHWATVLGNGWIWAVGVVLFVSRRGVTSQALATLLLAALLTNSMVVALKPLVRRERPSAHAPNPLLAGAGDLVSFDRFSFPSGHAANAFALATLLGVALPLLSPLLALLASVICMSRVALRQHFPSDVAAGALLGGAAGWASFTLLCV